MISLEHMLYKLIFGLHNEDVSRWEALKYKVVKHQLKSIPETKVIEALKAYIDGVWSGPVEAQRLWNEVLKNIKEFDEQGALAIEQRISGSRIKDAILDVWRNNGHI